MAAVEVLEVAAELVASFADLLDDVAQLVAVGHRPCAVLMAAAALSTLQSRKCRRASSWRNLWRAACAPSKAVATAAPTSTGDVRPWRTVPAWSSIELPDAPSAKASSGYNPGSQGLEVESVP